MSGGRGQLAMMCRRYLLSGTSAVAYSCSHHQIHQSAARLLPRKPPSAYYNPLPPNAFPEMDDSTGDMGAQDFHPYERGVGIKGTTVEGDPEDKPTSNLYNENLWKAHENYDREEERMARTKTPPTRGLYPYQREGNDFPHSGAIQGRMRPDSGYEAFGRVGYQKRFERVDADDFPNPRANQGQQQRMLPDGNEAFGSGDFEKKFGIISSNWSNATDKIVRCPCFVSDAFYALLSTFNKQKYAKVDTSALPYSEIVHLAKRPDHSMNSLTLIGSITQAPEIVPAEKAGGKYVVKLRMVTTEPITYKDHIYLISGDSTYPDVQSNIKNAASLLKDDDEFDDVLEIDQSPSSTSSSGIGLDDDDDLGGDDLFSELPVGRNSKGQNAPDFPSSSFPSRSFPKKTASPQRPGQQQRQGLGTRSRDREYHSDESDDDEDGLRVIRRGSINNNNGGGDGPAKPPGTI